MSGLRISIALLLCLLAFALGEEESGALLAEGQKVSETKEPPNEGADGNKVARAAPTSNVEILQGELKPYFKIHYRDGIQKAIFDETPNRAPAQTAPDFEDNEVGRGREFDAYDDTRLVDPRLESPLFIPEIYRNDSSEEQEQRPPPAGISPRPLVAPQLQSGQPISVRTTTPRPLGQIRPAQPFARPQGGQFPPPSGRPQQPRPPPAFPAQQQQFRPNPQQPFAPRPGPPPVPPPPAPLPEPIPRPPPFPPQPSQPLPRPPATGLFQIRTGVCPQSIFYVASPVSAFDLQRVYTHFAVVVSVDQCARTCHEFNCDVAILDPLTRHCQFNPSTSFRLPPSCPQWPNPLFRNNVRFGQELIKIGCVTCQQRRRVPNRAQQQFQRAAQPSTRASPQVQFGGRGIGLQQAQPLLPTPSSRQQQQPFILRTTNRERIDEPANHLDENGVQLRVANAAKTLKTDEEGGRDLSSEFHKLERLLKSAEDYLDESESKAARGEGKEVASWREGHPQGDGFSPLKINPLRRPYLADLNRPQAVFYSSDSLSPRQTGAWTGWEQTFCQEAALLREIGRRRQGGDRGGKGRGRGWGCGRAPAAGGGTRRGDDEHTMKEQMTHFLASLAPSPPESIPSFSLAQMLVWLWNWLSGGEHWHLVLSLFLHVLGICTGLWIWHVFPEQPENRRKRMPLRQLEEQRGEEEAMLAEESDETETGHGEKGSERRRQHG